MQEILIFASGTIVGTVSTCIAVYLGGNLVMRTYMELTQPHYELPDTVEDTPEDTRTRTQRFGDAGSALLYIWVGPTLPFHIYCGGHPGTVEVVVFVVIK